MRVRGDRVYEHGGKLWSADEDAKLIDLLVNQGLTCRAAAEHLPNRTRTAVIGRAARMRLEGTIGTGGEWSAPRAPAPPPVVEAPPPVMTIALVGNPRPAGGCATPGCRGPRQPGRDLCAECCTAAYVRRRVNGGVRENVGK